MTALELKQKLIAQINSTDDEGLLNHLSIVIDFELENEEVYRLSPEEIAGVKEGIKQIDNGQFLSNDEANKIIDKCLSR